jgi:autotransporter strand-loop-strand O-heptosyltransferase
MSKPFTEFQSNVIRLYNDNEKSGWWNNFMHTWDCWDWNWNPIKECKTLEDWHDFETITPQQVKTAVDEMIIKTIGDEITVETDIKKVYIYFGSKALGDSIGWMPYCLEYKKKFKVNEVVVSTYWNNLFEPVYPELTFVEPGVLVSNINKRHIIDFYGLNLKEKDLFDNPFPLKNYKECGVQEQATNCLGLEYKEIKPKIVIPDKTRRIKGKYVCIAIQSTCQSKYWNLKGGWNAIVKYLKKRGYKVICIDKYTQFGIKDHWNFIPKGVINKTGEFPIEDRIHDIKHAELFIGISSGLAWVAYAVGTPVVMISGMSKPWNEFNTGIQRVHNDKVCNGCWHTHEFDANNWLWCPENKNFECSKQISFNMVKDKVDNIIGNL